MPILDANLEILKKELNLNTKELSDLLFDYGLEVEEIDEKNNSIKIDITANRLELLSTFSLLEHLKYFLGKKENKFPEVKESNLKVFVDKKNKRKTLAFILKNVKVDENRLKDAINFQEKIHISLFRKRKKAALGLYDLDKIKGNIFFKAMEPEKIKFVPLNENREIKGKELLNIKKGQEYGYLLENYEKDGYWPVFVDEEEKILSVPPIINSNDVGNVNVNTKNIFIELSGDDLEYLKKHLPFLIKVFHSIFEGEIYSVEVIFDNFSIKTIDLIEKNELKDFSFVKRYFDLNLNEKDVKNLLKKVAYIEENEKLFLPWYRYDLYTEQDIAEDLVIAYGINKLDFKEPNLFTVGEFDINEEKKEYLKELLIGLGFLEIIGEFLTSNKKLAFFEENKDIKLLNSTDENFDTVRTTLKISLLEFLQNNNMYPYPQKVFEIGKVYSNKLKRETTNLAFAWSQNKITYNEAKQILIYLLERMGINKEKLEFKESNKPYFIEGRQAEVFLEDKKIAEIGEVNPELLLKFNLDIPTIMGEVFNIFELREVKNLN
jgi:phenylalanyl-tRNA synthetase beta chain